MRLRDLLPLVTVAVALTVVPSAHAKRCPADSAITRYVHPKMSDIRARGVGCMQAVSVADRISGSGRYNVSTRFQAGRWACARGRWVLIREWGPMARVRCRADGARIGFRVFP